MILLKGNVYYLTDNYMKIKKIHFLFLIFLSVLVSCQKTKTPKPKDLIPKDKMVNLLFDMYIANRSRNIKNNNGNKKPNYFPLIYKKYNVDSTQFKVSHEYYMKELPEYIAIYKKLKDSVNSLLKKEERQLKIEDSLRLLKRKKKKPKLKKNVKKKIQVKKS